MDKFKPQKKLWKIGDREFTQEPLGLGGITSILSLFGDMIQELSGKIDIERLSKMNTDNPLDVAYLVSIALKSSPKSVIDLFAVVLRAEGDDDKAYLSDHCTFKVTMGIASEFLKQNDVKEIKEDFLAFTDLLRAELGESKPSDQGKKASTD